MPKGILFVAGCIILVSLSCGRGTEDLSIFAICEGYPDWETSEYILPYKEGETYEISQGNCRSITHNRVFQYAYDFKMNVGVEIIASRGGKVVHAGITDDCSGEEVIIQHEDNTYGRYLHLSRVDVRVDQVLAQGDQIGLSGGTGCTGGFPHLHFDVSTHPQIIETIPVTFRNTDPNPRGLLNKKKYTAKAL